MPGQGAAQGHLVRYNEIELDVSVTHAFDYEPVFDGPNYLWTRVFLHVGALINAEATSYDENRPGSPIQVSGMSPAETTEEIHWHLTQPQKNLAYQIGGTFLLNTPGVQNAGGLGQKYIDCNNGPKPIHCHVTKTHGFRTFQVDFQIETFINQSFLYRANDDHVAPTILSNRWTMSEHLDVNDHYRCIRTTHGRLICRSDNLWESNRVPDDFRAVMLIPVSRSFRRDSIHITASEDGNALDWTVVDSERALSVKAAGVTDIKGGHSVVAKLMSLETFAGGVVRNVGQVVNAVRGGSTGGNGQPDFNPGVIAFRTARNMVGPAVQFATLNFPGVAHDVNVQVWGNTDTSKRALSSVAHRVLGQQLGFLGRALYSFETREYRSLDQPYVEVSAVAIGGVIQGTRYAAANVQGVIVPNTSTEFPVGDVIRDASGDILVPEAFDSNSPGQGPPNHRRTRGNFTAAIAAQVLQDATEFQPQPPIPRNAIQETPQ